MLKGASEDCDIEKENKKTVFEIGLFFLRTDILARYRSHVVQWLMATPSVLTSPYPDSS